MIRLCNALRPGQNETGKGVNRGNRGVPVAAPHVHATVEISQTAANFPGFAGIFNCLVHHRIFDILLGSPDSPMTVTEIVLACPGRNDLRHLQPCRTADHLLEITRDFGAVFSNCLWSGKHPPADLLYDQANPETSGQIGFIDVTVTQWLDLYLRMFPEVG